jgi:predicted nucleic acid-binding protein
MLDTSILIPAIGDKVRPSDDPASVAFDQAMLLAKKNILIAAPSASEFMRRSPKEAIPRTKNVQIVAFDQRAADILGSKFPKEVLTVYRDSSARRQSPLHYIKYDAMIVACAVRHRARVFVSTDTDQCKIASAMALEVTKPSDYLSSQPSLFTSVTRPR